MKVRNLATSLRSLLPTAKTAPQPKTELEETKELIELAEQFDRLINEPGWEKVLKHMASIVQNEIYTATSKPLMPSDQQIHVIRWDAKRDLLDSTIGYVEDVRRSRDEVVAQYKENVDAQ